MLYKAEFVERISPECDIETKTEEFFGTDLEFITEFFGVVDGGF